MGKRYELSDDIKERALKLYTQDKMSVALVAKTLEINYSATSRFLRRNTVIRSPSKATKAIRWSEKRICRHCNNEFIVMNNAQVYCRECCPTKSAYQRLKYYNLSQQEFESLRLKQHNLCVLCEIPLVEGGSTNLNIDHCHVTGRVRGILCHRCNIIVGFLDKDDWAERLQRVAAYIKGTS